MADTGKLAAEGYGAGALKYMVLDGFSPNPVGPLVACLASMGMGAASIHARFALDGFAANPGSGGGGSGATGGCIFGGAVITGWLEFM